jgi:hypothetical protein
LFPTSIEPFRVFRVFRGSLFRSEKEVARSEEMPEKDAIFEDARPEAAVGEGEVQRI